MSKRFLRVLSFLLVLVLTVQMSGVLEAAALTPKTGESVVPPAMPETTNISISETTAIPTEEPEIVGEDITKREESVKHFRLSDGSWMAVSYSDAVHYQGSDGSWLEIDNTLKADMLEVSVPMAALGSDAVTTASTQGLTSFNNSVEITAASLVNTANSFGVSLPSNLNTQSWVGTFYGNHSLYFRFENINSANAQTVSASEDDSAGPTEREAALRVNTYSSVAYENVLPGVNIIYELTGQKLKENILFSRLETTPISISFVVWAEDLQMTVQDDGSYVFSADNDPQFVIPAPFMVDADGECSDQVQVTTEEIAEDTYRFTYTPDRNWLQSSDRDWPVVLDPVTCAIANIQTINDTYIRSGYPSYTYYTKTYMYVGYLSGPSKNVRALVRHNEIPTLNSGDVITNAQLHLTGFVHTGAGNIQVNAYAITGDWPFNYIYWKNQPAYEDEVLDYQIIDSTSNKNYVWDITSAAQRWYAGDLAGKGRLENQGVMLIAPGEENTGVINYAAFWSSDSSGTIPQLYIYYRNTTGIESYWDYTSAGAGRAGTVSVNDYTGNLVVSRTDMAYSGNRMPASIGFTYNANDCSSNIGYGNGWRPNYAQTVTLVEIAGNNYYCWIDGDGTRIYFYNSDGTWKDENGLNYTLTVNDSSFTIQDRDGNQMLFDSNGRLTQVIDGKISANKIQVTYVSGVTTPKIQTVTDGAGRVYTFSYGTDNNLSSIQYSGTGTTALETVTYAYSSDNLTTVTYADNNTATYAYTSGYLTSATGCQGEQITVTYGSDTGKVGQVTATDGSTVVSSAAFLYGDNYTKVTDHNGRWCIYQFNNQGNTVSVYNHRGQALYGSYSEETPNQLVNSSRLQDTVTNLLSTRSYSTSWSQTVTVTPEKAYTLSGTGSGTLTLTAGSVTQTSTGVNGTRTEVTITIPSGVTTVTASGSTAFSELQLEQAEAASRYNMLLDTDMTSVTSWIGTGTADSDGQTTAETSPRANLDSNSIAITGSSTTAKQYTQTLQVSGVNGDKYSFGAWVKSASVPLGNLNTQTPDTDPTRRFGIQVRLLNGATVVAEKYIAANDACAEWQFISGSVDANAAYDTVEFSLVFDYNANIAYFDGAQLFKENFAYVYEYDDNGRIETVTDLEGNVTTYTYRGDSSDITSITLPGNKTYSYTYNDQTLLTGTTSATGIQTTHTYDSYGNNTQTAITYSGADRVIQSDQTYTSDGNFQATVTGGDRNTVTYNYNTQTSTLTSVTDPLGNTTANTYDTLRRLQSVTSGNATASYTYDKERLSTIFHSGGTNGTTYSFAYTTAGLTDTVSVGSYELVNNTYNSGTWTLASQEYGNGDAWHYTYNEFDDLVSAYTTGGTSGTEIRYFYNSEGALARIEQYNTTLSGTSITARTLVSTERYYYDTTDRMVRITRADTNGTYEATWVYDHNDNVTQLVETINGTATTTSYTYDADNRVSSLTSGGLTTTYTYDGYGRIASKATPVTGAVTATTSYTFRNPGDGLTSTQVETAAVNLGDYRDNYTYSYDANGNITSIVLDGRTTTYVYDSLNQLVRENNESAGKTWVWTYDTGGNILSKTEYAYTTSELGEAASTVTYGYNDANWGDLLTAYDGVTITHDEIGNPLNDGTWTYAWSGRQLASMTDGTTTWSYKYNADGLRTEKTNGTTTYKYVYSGSTLVQMSVGDDVLNFYYDNGTPVSLTYNDSTYYYITNLQGDVVAIVSQTGRTLATYTYDAWGNPLSVNSTFIAGLAEMNPLRYRGYVYDSETDLYYLQSRYYDPGMGRFINADSYPSTGQGVLGNNMFAYCNNNPVILTDPYGEFGWFTIANAVIGAVVGAATQIATNILTKQENVFAGVVGAAAGGAVYNVVALTTGSLIAASAAGSATEALVNEAGSYLTGQKKLTADNLMNSAANVVCKTAENTITAAVTGKIASGVVKTNSGWFQPKKFVSSFTGKYAKKIWGQTAAQGALTTAYNTIKAGLKLLDAK